MEIEVQVDWKCCKYDCSKHDITEEHNCAAWFQPSYLAMQNGYRIERIDCDYYKPKGD
jgi:hypothetical protein